MISNSQSSISNPQFPQTALVPGASSAIALALARLFPRCGRILNVASLAGFTPGPLMSTYYASKAFVISHSLALRQELRNTGVTVTLLCPGPTPTEFRERAKIEPTSLRADLAAIPVETV